MKEKERDESHFACESVGWSAATESSMGSTWAKSKETERGENGRQGAETAPAHQRLTQWAKALLFFLRNSKNRFRILQQKKRTFLKLINPISRVFFNKVLRIDKTMKGGTKLVLIKQKKTIKRLLLWFKKKKKVFNGRLWGGRKSINRVPPSESRLSSRKRNTRLLLNERAQSQPYNIFQETLVSSK